MIAIPAKHLYVMSVEGECCLVELGADEAKSFEEEPDTFEVAYHEVVERCGIVHRESTAISRCMNRMHKANPLFVNTWG